MLQAEAERLRAALESERTARVAGEQSAAVLAAQLEALRTQVADHREARGLIEAERDQAREQANQAQDEARGQARQIEQQAAELADLRARVACIPAEVAVGHCACRPSSCRTSSSSASQPAGWLL